ncbi:MAG: TRAP transporter small permease [Pseudomonadales bacterium]|nr:TRAP transporter small permease [Pseudomonadales bacterium]
MALLVIISILGRALFLLPVPGDFEIVGMGTAIAVFLSLPYCQLQRGHVTVDMFMAHASKGTQTFFDVVSSYIFAFIALLFAWQMLFGLADMFRQGDISVIIGIPLWIIFPFGVVSFLLLLVCCIYTAYLDLRSMRQ